VRLLVPRAVAGQGRQRQRQRGALRYADLVRVQRQRHHRVVADQCRQLDDSGGAVAVEDALVRRVRGVVVAQQFGRVVMDGLLVGCGERAAAVAQRLDGLIGQAGLARLRFMGEPLELAVLVYQAWTHVVLACSMSYVW
jgi:hypothetical protein